MFDLIKKAFNLLFSYKSEYQKGKKPWKSKQIWANFFAILVIIVAKYADFNLTPEDVGYFLGSVNVIVRFLSKGGSVGFYEDTVIK